MRVCWPRRRSSGCGRHSTAAKRCGHSGIEPPRRRRTLPSWGAWSGEEPRWHKTLASLNYRRSNSDSVGSRVALRHKRRSTKQPRREIGWKVVATPAACEASHLRVRTGHKYVDLHRVNVAPITKTLAPGQRPFNVAAGDAHTPRRKPLQPGRVPAGYRAGNCPSPATRHPDPGGDRGGADSRPPQFAILGLRHQPGSETRAQ
jgi:hypothetical protein